MIQKATIISISDKCGIFTGNVFHIFRGFYHKIGKPKDFVKFSTRSTSASLSNLKGSKINGIFIRSKKEQLKIFSRSIHKQYLLRKFNLSIELRKK